MKSTNGRSRRGLHATVLAIVIVFVLTASAAFPQVWNSAARSIGLESLTFNEDGFRLGLDLQGGAHLVYQADMSQIPSDQRADALQGIRDVVERRVNAFGVSEPVVQTINEQNRIIVELAGVFDVSQAISEIGETPILEFKLPNQNIQVDPTEEQQEEINAAQEVEREAALEVLDRALDEGELEALSDEYNVQTLTIDENDPVFDGLATEIEEEGIRVGVIDGLYESTSAIHVTELVAVNEAEEIQLSHILICHNESESCQADRSKEEAEALANELLDELTPANFAEKAAEVSEGPSSVDGGALGWVVKGQMVAPFEEAAFDLADGEISDVVETQFGYHVIYRADSRSANTYDIAQIELPWTTLSDIVDIDPWENTELSGKDIRRASVASDPNTGAWYVVLEFNSEGAELFGTLTEDNVGNIIGIFLDGTPISTPVVQQAIYGGEATITGAFTLDEARLLAQRLNAGALPVPIELVSQQTVGPTLGAISLQRSIEAALIGFIVVGAFMILYYRLAGLLAVLALLIYTAVNLALYKWLGVTMTLSSIAGFILSIGMAVDANVLIFERLKEELQSGRDLPTAIDEGFRRAWTSIRDGNLTTLIAAAVLFSMSTSFIKGFALTLALGILVSMATAIFVTRIFLQWMSGFVKSKWLYNGPRNNDK